MVLLGTRSPGSVDEIWRGDFDGLHAEMRGTVFNLTVHSRITGRSHRMEMLECLVASMLGHPAIRFAPVHEIANEVIKQCHEKRREIRWGSKRYESGNDHH